MEVNDIVRRRTYPRKPFRVIGKSGGRIGLEVYMDPRWGERPPRVWLPAAEVERDYVPWGPGPSSVTDVIYG